jgi:hypothetical protein
MKNNSHPILSRERNQTKPTNMKGISMKTQTDIDQSLRVHQRKKLAIALLAAAITAGFTWYQSSKAEAQESGRVNANCLEGTWLLRLPDGRLAKETVVAGRNGQQFHFHGHVTIPNPQATLGGLFPDAQDIGGGFFGSAQRTGPNTFEARAIFHVVNVVNGIPTDIAYIAIDEAVVVLPDCDTQLVTLTESYFLPEQDADGDGIPDDGEVPFLSFSDIPLTGKRL